VSVWLWGELERRLGVPEAPQRRATLRRLLGDGWVPIAGLALLAVLQNIDIIIARHQLGHDRAGSYAVAAVAAKALVWVAIGLGLQLLPQATARAAGGEDPRPVLARAFAVLGAVAAPALVVFAVAPKLVLRVAFGEDTVDASGALVVLGGAMLLLATAYLTVQYLFALGRATFLWALGAIAVAEVVVLLSAGSPSIAGFADRVALVQLASAAAMVAFALRSRSG
jgi:O-antigen/teichoic acid export membrane protein